MDQFVEWVTGSADVLGLLLAALVAYLLGGKTALRRLFKRIRPIDGSVPRSSPDDLTPAETPLGKQVARKCMNCKHFSKEVFQREVLQKNPIFSEVSRWRRPSQLAEGEEAEPSVSLREDTWEAFGVCTNPVSPNTHTGIHQSSSCEAFEAETG